MESGYIVVGGYGVVVLAVRLVKVLHARIDPYRHTAVERDGADKVFYLLGVIFGKVSEQPHKCRGVDVRAVLFEPRSARISLVGEVLMFKVLGAGREHDAYLVVRIMVRLDALGREIVVCASDDFRGVAVLSQFGQYILRHHASVGRRVLQA